MLKPTLLLLLLMLLIYHLVSPLATARPGEGQAKVTQAKPRFPGGPNALFDYLEKKMKYPYNNSIGEQEAVVKLKFWVNTDGSLSDLSVMNEVDDDLQVAALQIVQMMPNWEPARQNGRPIAKAVILPIPFHGQQHLP